MGNTQFVLSFCISACCCLIRVAKTAYIRQWDCLAALEHIFLKKTCHGIINVPNEDGGVVNMQVIMASGSARCLRAWGEIDAL